MLREHIHTLKIWQLVIFAADSDCHSLIKVTCA